MYIIQVDYFYPTKRHSTFRKNKSDTPKSNDPVKVKLKT